jgi:lysophospholipase L1-like esterase
MLTQAALTANKLYRAQVDLVVTAGTFYLMHGSTQWGSALTTSGVKVCAQFASNASAVVWANTAATAGTADNVVYDLLSLEECSALERFQSIFGRVCARLSRPLDIACGVWMNVDDPSNIKNGVFCTWGLSTSNLQFCKMVNGVITYLGAWPYSDHIADAPAEIYRAPGTDTYQFYYNGALKGEYTITGMTGHYHGLFSSDSTASFSDFFFTPAASTATVNLLMLGDSKTSAFGVVAGRFTSPSWRFAEIGPRISNTGWTTAVLQDNIDAYLAALGAGTPAHILINIGVNDLYGAMVEGTIKADLLYILAALHTKFPGVPCYFMRPWSRAKPTEANTYAGWIDDLVAGDALARLGPDERIFLEGGDDGATWTSDGVHPTNAGYTLTATKWREAIGV